MDERRKFMRFNVIMNAEYSAGEVTGKVEVSDFCKEGVGVAGDRSMEQGQNVDLELMIPGDEIPVVLQGEVAWSVETDESSEGYKSGIRFKEVRNEDRGRILEYIYQRWIASTNEEKLVG